MKQIEISIVFEESGGFGSGPWGSSDDFFYANAEKLINGLILFGAKLPNDESGVRISEHSWMCGQMTVLAVCCISFPYPLETTKEDIESFLSDLFNMPALIIDYPDTHYDYRLSETYDGCFELPEEIIDQIDVCSLSCNCDAFRYKFIEDQTEIK